MENKITKLESFKIMNRFLIKYFERTNSEDIGSLLGDMELIENRTSDPAVWTDWEQCFNQVIGTREGSEHS